MWPPVAISNWFRTWLVSRQIAGVPVNHRLFVWLTQNPWALLFIYFFFINSVSISSWYQVMLFEKTIKEKFFDGGKVTTPAVGIPPSSFVSCALWGMCELSSNSLQGHDVLQWSINRTTGWKEEPFCTHESTSMCVYSLVASCRRANSQGEQGLYLVI